MRLTIWQFLALIGALVVLYFVYNMWWSKQSGEGWRKNFSNSVQGEEERTSTTSDGTGGGGGDGQPKVETPSPW